MIKDFSVHNFRSFTESGPIAIAPLTCFVGRNSSGKSSILHALTILRQSQEYPALGARVPQLNLNGPLIEAGEYKDVVTGHDETIPLGFNFSLRLSPIRSRFDSEEPTSLVELDVPRPFERTSFHLPWRYVPYARGDGPIPQADASVDFQFLPQKPFGPILSRLAFAVPTIGRATFVRTLGEQRVQHWRGYFEGLPSKSLELFFPRASFFPVIDFRQHSSRRSREHALLRRFLRYTYKAFSEVAEFLSEAKMVGPFRTPPARRYSFTGFGAVDTGLTGQRAVDLLITERLLGQPGEHLRTATSFWLKRLGLAKTVDIKHLARRSNIFEVLISGAGGAPTANFADVGFGISQVLPVLVQGFLVRRGGTFIVQQPELHLHPDAQAALADFFLYLASQGINSIVETHSEYLLLRLRRRLAERSKPITIGLPSERASKSRTLNRRDVSVLYVGQSHGHGSLRKIGIDKAFQFDNLPDGFMNQAISDRLALLKAIKGYG